MRDNSGTRYLTVMKLNFLHSFNQEDAKICTFIVDGKFIGLFDRGDMKSIVLDKALII